MFVLKKKYDELSKNLDSLSIEKNQYMSFYKTYKNNYENLLKFTNLYGIIDIDNYNCLDEIYIICNDNLIEHKIKNNIPLRLYVNETYTTVLDNKEILKIKNSEIIMVNYKITKPCKKICEGCINFTGGKCDKGMTHFE